MGNAALPQCISFSMHRIAQYSIPQTPGTPWSPAEVIVESCAATGWTGAGIDIESLSNRHRLGTDVECWIESGGAIRCVVQWVPQSLLSTALESDQRIEKRLRGMGKKGVGFCFFRANYCYDEALVRMRLTKRGDTTIQVALESPSSGGQKVGGVA